MFDPKIYLVMDFRCSDVQHNIFDLLMVEFSVTERELDRLKHALTLLSEAEKHLRVSSERPTWFTATLLQLGSMSSPARTQSTSSRRRSSMATEEDRVSMPREATAHKQNSDEQSGSSTSFMAADRCNSMIKEKLVGLTPETNESQFIDGKSLTVSHGDCISRRTTLACEDSEMLTNIWLLSIEKCHSKKLRLLLHSYGKLVSVSEMKGKFPSKRMDTLNIPAFPFLSPLLYGPTLSSWKFLSVRVSSYWITHVECSLTFSKACSWCIHSFYLVESTTFFGLN